LNNIIGKLLPSVAPPTLTIRELSADTSMPVVVPI
jgi:hypothetical protein